MYVITGVVAVVLIVLSIRSCGMQKKIGVLSEKQQVLSSALAMLIKGMPKESRNGEDIS